MTATAYIEPPGELEITIPDKLMRILTTKARHIVLIGGRGSAKSESAARIILAWCQTQAIDILCGRELQNSIDESVHKLLKSLINDIPLGGFEVDKKKIDYLPGGGFRFKGIGMNSSSVKSYYGFVVAWFEEAQDLSEVSIRDLIPTIRAEGSKLIYTANPQSSADPFSKRFINPFIDEVIKNGFYDDGEHCIIMINYQDNPWFPAVLEKERLHDFKTLPRALYDHIWEGEFNDSVDNSLILAEWFDACIDAHKVLGFKAEGVEFASHDPSDEGDDDKGYAYRHGSVILDVQSKGDGDINEGCDWAVDLALERRPDAFNWDCDGMGVGLSRQVGAAFKDKSVTVSQFKGSESPANPNALYDSIEQIQKQKTNKESFRNKRAQNYFYLRDRVKRTYDAVVKKKYGDPDKMISFDSGIKEIGALRSELTRMPIKPNGNGKFELYTKEEMKRRFKFKSPNLADSVMMTMVPPVIKQAKAVSPQPLPAHGITSSRR